MPTLPLPSPGYTPHEPRSKPTRSLKPSTPGAELHVPALWLLEVANAPVVLVRRRRLTEVERTQALAALRQLSVKMDQEGASLAFTKLSTLAAEQRLSVYDAVYLELALREKLPLACKDGPLRAAAKRCRVKLV